MSMLVLIIIQNIIFSIYTAYHLYLSFFTKYKKSVQLWGGGMNLKMTVVPSLI